MSMILSNEQMGQLVKRARKLKSLKTGKKYTQQQLADDIELSRSYVGDIESGRSKGNFEVFSKIADACELDVNFFTVKDEKEFESRLNDLPNTNSKTTDIIKGMIQTLIQQGLIKDENNIDQKTLDVLISALKLQIKIELDNK